MIDPLVMKKFHLPVKIFPRKAGTGSGVPRVAGMWTSVPVPAFRLLICIIALFVGIAGCLAPTDRDIARQVERKLRAEYHPQQLSVTVARHSNFSSRLRRLEITMSGFAADSLPLMSDSITPTAIKPTSKAKAGSSGKTVTVDQLTVNCHDFTIADLPVRELIFTSAEMKLLIKGDIIQVLRSQPADGTITFTEDAITQFLRTQKLPVQNVKVAINKEGVVIRGQARRYILFPVELRGKIIARQPAILELQNPKLRVLRVPFPRMLVTYILRDINPLVDINARLKLPEPLTINKITHGDGALTFYAQLPLASKETK